MDKKQIEELRKLKTLLNEGVITKEEFNEARDNLLKASDNTNAVAIDTTVYSDVENDSIESIESDVSIAESNDVNADDKRYSDPNNKSDTRASSAKDNKKTIMIIAAIAAVIVLIFVGFSVSNNAKAQKTREALPGEWTYAESYNDDGQYDAKLDSSITFTEDEKIEIRIDDCVCKGTWSVDAGYDHINIFIFDETVTGSSANMDELLYNGLSYKEYNDGVTLYWYDSTSTHYYKHK